MESRYKRLRTIGTLALVLAWVLLVLGIGLGIVSWLGLSSAQSLIDSTDLGVNLGLLPIFGAVPGVLGGLLGFLVYYSIGKVLKLLVDLDERTMQSGQSAPQPAAASDPLVEASGEMKRQAKLISANLEATQDVQRQLAALEARLAGGALTPVASDAGKVVDAVVSDVAEAADL